MRARLTLNVPVKMSILTKMYVAKENPAMSTPSESNAVLVAIRFQ